MVIAIIGSQHYPKMDLVVEYVKSLSSDTVVISRGTRGVDHVAFVTAHYRKLRVGKYPADWDRDGNSAIYQSNVKVVSKAEEIVAFWDGESLGTLETIEIARQFGKSVLCTDRTGKSPKILPDLTG